YSLVCFESITDLATSIGQRLEQLKGNRRVGQFVMAIDMNGGALGVKDANSRKLSRCRSAVLPNHWWFGNSAHRELNASRSSPCRRGRVNIPHDFFLVAGTTRPFH